MRLLSSDLFRNFSIGFVLGTLLVVGANASDWEGGLATPAQAATMTDLVAPTAEFTIPAGEPR